MVLSVLGWWPIASGVVCSRTPPCGQHSPPSMLGTHPIPIPHRPSAQAALQPVEGPLRSALGALGGVLSGLPDLRLPIKQVWPGVVQCVSIWSMGQHWWLGTVLPAVCQPASPRFERPMIDRCPLSPAHHLAGVAVLMAAEHVPG